MNRFLTVVFILASAFGHMTSAAEAAKELALLDGSRIKGRVMSASASEVTVMTDFGVLRIALDKLTTTSREEVLQESQPNTEALLKRIQELETQVAQLRQENESLRRQAMAAPATTAPRSSAPQQTQPSSGGSYTISSTGKRHNSGCRYYGTGRSCGPNEGIACKICGG